MKKRSLGICRTENRHVVGITVKFGELVRRSNDRVNSENIESFLGEGSRLVETDDVDFSSDVNASRRDTEDLHLAETSDRERSSDSHRGGECRRNDDSDEIEGADDDDGPGDL